MHYKEALKFDKNNSKLVFNIAVSYLYKKEYYNSIEYLKMALAINPKYTTAYINLGISYKRLKHYDKAIKAFEQALDINENDPDIYYNLANTHSSLENYSLALKYFNKVLNLDKNYYKAYHAIGLVYNHMMQYDTAYKYFDKTLQYKPSYSDAIFAKSLIQLRNKDYVNGWKNYESRWEASNPLIKLNYAVDFYEGQNLENKIILIQEEQGFGDNIQFIRYIDKLLEQKPKIIYVALRKELQKLFKLIDGITIVSDEETLYDVDYIVSLLSLPRIFKTTFQDIPNKIPYLPMPEVDDISSKIIQKTKKLKVGFAYKGNNDHSNDRFRSIPIEIFKNLFELKDIEFYNLQIDSSKEELKDIIKNSNNIYDCKEFVSDFYDSSLIINKLDLVISVDSALAHFAGALNKKTFLLLPQNAEWRWFEEINYSPWYPSLKLFRQKELSLWIDLIQDIKNELNTLSKNCT